MSPQLLCGYETGIGRFSAPNKTIRVGEEAHLSCDDKGHQHCQTCEAHDVFFFDTHTVCSCHMTALSQPLSARRINCFKLDVLVLFSVVEIICFFFFLCSCRSKHEEDRR